MLDYSYDFDLDVVLGLKHGKAGLNKFGENPDVDTGTVPEHIWSVGGLWVPPTQARVHNVTGAATDVGTLVSAGTFGVGSSRFILRDDSATFITDGVAVGDCVLNDTKVVYAFVTTIVSEIQLEIFAFQYDPGVGDVYRVVTAASTGAAVVWVPRGLGSSWLYASEFVIMAGAGGVNTVNEYQRIHRARVIHSGSNQTNDGNIDFTAAVDGTITARIAASKGQTQMAIWTVPANKIFVCKMVYASVTRPGAALGAMVDCDLNVRPFANIANTPWQVRHDYSACVDGDSSPKEDFDPYKIFWPLTDITIRANFATDSNMKIEAGFSGYIVDYPFYEAGLL